MAIGIDKGLHRKLLEGLLQLTASEEDVYWKTVLSDLQLAYQENLDMLRKAELTALKYNEVQALVRTKVATEFRNRKAKKR